MDRVRWKHCRFDVALAAAGLLSATPALASEHADNRLTVGAGVGIAPDYEGSDNYVMRPVLGALARVRGHNISFKGTSLAVDLIPEYQHQRVKFIFAPFVNFNYDRASTPRDPVVKLIRKRKIAVEMGGTVGVTFNGVITSPYDSLTIQLSGSHDVGDVHKSFIITPTAQYLTPLSEKAVVGMSVSADFVGGRYSRTYFGIGPNSSAASGLPRFTPGGGAKSATVGLMGAHALSHDLNHGFAVGALVSYERLLGDDAASPLVATRGSPSQFSAALGLGYTF